MKDYTEEKMRAFVTILCHLGLSESAIYGISHMMWGDISSMTELVDFIEENPHAKEQEIIQKATRIMGFE
jgi:hypothetical protein